MRVSIYKGTTLTFIKRVTSAFQFQWAPKSDTCNFPSIPEIYKRCSFRFDARVNFTIVNKDIQTQFHSITTIYFLLYTMSMRVLWILVMHQLHGNKHKFLVVSIISIAPFNIKVRFARKLCDLQQVNIIATLSYVHNHRNIEVQYFFAGTNAFTNTQCSKVP